MSSITIGKKLTHPVTIRKRKKKRRSCRKGLLSGTERIPWKVCPNLPDINIISKEHLNKS